MTMWACQAPGVQGFYPLSGHGRGREAWEPEPCAQLRIPHRSSHMSASGTRAKTWHGTACRGTPMTHRTVGTHSASSVMNAIWTMTNCLSICVETTTSATSVTRMGPRTTTGGCRTAQGGLWNTQSRLGRSYWLGW